MDPVTIALIAAAFGSKLYGTHKQNEKYKDVRRDRRNAFATAEAKRKKLTDEALLRAKETRSKYQKRNVDDAVANNTEALTKEFAQLPNADFTGGVLPGRSAEPSIITNARNTANTAALKDINRYAGDTANMAALSSAFRSPEQMNAAMMNRSMILEKARQQQALAQILGLQMGEFDPYSMEADLSKGLGDILMMASMA
jgi:hypothetical protein